jgi:hypothetical protein
MPGDAATHSAPGARFPQLRKLLKFGAINRTWTWGRRGWPSMSRELVPYIAIVFGTLGIAIAATAVADAVLRDANASDATRTFLVGGTYLMVYVVMFLVRFLLFDRMYSRADRADRALAQDA